MPLPALARRFGEGSDLAPWLLAGGDRALCARCLPRRGPQEIPISLAGFVTEVLAPRVAGDAGAILAASLHACFDDLLAGRLGGLVLSFADLREPLLGLDGRTPCLQGHPCGSSMRHRRPIQSRASSRQPPPATPEMRLVASALVTSTSTPKDHDFAVFFWQVVRVRTLFYRHMVQRPHDRGPPMVHPLL